MSGDEALLTLHYKVLCLWKLDAQEFVQNHTLCMYSMLPAMKNARVSLLVQAVEEMKQRYTIPRIGDHLARFRTIMERSKTLTEQEKQTVEDQLYGYDSLMDNSSFARQKKVEGAQRTIVDFVEARFPTLKELAEQRVTLIRSTETLSVLAKQVATAPDEATARWVFDTLVA